MHVDISARKPATTWFGMGQRDWRRLRKQLPNYLYLVPFLIGFAMFTVYPIAFGFWMSLHEWDILGKNPPFVGLNNYAELMKDDLWWLTLRQTLQYSVQTVALMLVMGLGAALIAFQDFRGRQVTRVLYYFPATLSVAVVGLVWQWLLNTEYGLVNYVLSLVGIEKIRWLVQPALMLPSLSIAAVWAGFGFPMLIFLAGLSDIPQHLYDAAKVDGSNAWSTFWRITLPLLRPTMLFVVVTQFIGHLQEFGLPYIVVGITTQYTAASGYHHWTVIVYLFQIAWHWYRMGYGSAMAFALAAVIICITVIEFRLLGRRLQY